MKISQETKNNIGALVEQCTNTVSASDLFAEKKETAEISAVKKIRAEVRELFPKAGTLNMEKTLKSFKDLLPANLSSRGKELLDEINEGLNNPTDQDITLFRIGILADDIILEWNLQV